LSFLGEVIRIAIYLRNKGLTVITGDPNKSLKSQMRRANKLGCKHVIILGQEELSNQVVSIKNMDTGEQTAVPLDSLDNFITEVNNGKTGFEKR